MAQSGGYIPPEKQLQYSLPSFNASGQYTVIPAAPQTQIAGDISLFVSGSR